MKRFWKYLAFSITLLSISIAHSQEYWCVKGGLNFSAISNDNEYLLQSVTLGLSREIPITKVLSIIPEILISRQGGIVKDEPVKSQFHEDYVYTYDIYMRVIYLEIPLLLSANIYSGTISTTIYGGPSYRLGIGDVTDRVKRNVIYNDDNRDLYVEYQHYDYDFTQGDFDNYFPNIKRSGIGLNIGFLIKYRFLSLDLMYTYALHKLGQLDQFYFIDKRTHVIHFLLGINF